MYNSIKSIYVYSGFWYKIWFIIAIVVKQTHQTHTHTHSSNTVATKKTLNATPTTITQKVGLNVIIVIPHTFTHD